MQSSTISNEAEACGSSPSPSGPSASSNPPLCSRCHDENKGGDGGKMMLMAAELSKGRDSTYKLLRLLRPHQAADGNDSAPSSETLASVAKEIEDSFSTCISLAINTTTSTGPATPPAITDPIHQRHETCKLEDSGESSLAPAATKGRRGCYKKRRSSCETWIKDSPNQMADEHAWRKYGQKAILNATHPRSYFRCTHKNDQGCQASKQVQQISNNPTLYRTTYTGYHTCNTTQGHVIMIKPSSSPSPIPFDRPDSGLHKQKSAESSVFINSESNTVPKEHGTLKDDPSGLEFLQVDDDKQYYSPAGSNYLTFLESTALREEQEPSSGQLIAAGLSSIAGGSSSTSAAGSGSRSGSWSGSDHGDVILMVSRSVSARLDDMDQIVAGFDGSHDQLDEIDWLEDEDCASW